MELVVFLTFWTRAMFVTCSRLDDPPGCQAGWALLRPPGRPLPSPGYDQCTACDPDYHCKHWCFEDLNLNTLSIPSYGSYIHVHFIKLPKAHCLRDNNHLMTSARLVQKVWNVVSEIQKCNSIHGSDQKQHGSYLEAMTSGNDCLEMASPWNSCHPFSGELQTDVSVWHRARSGQLF